MYTNRKFWLLLGGTGIFLALILGGQEYLVSIVLGRRADFTSSVTPLFLHFFLWFCFAPAIFGLAHSYPIKRQNALRRVGLHCLAAFGFYLFDALLWWNVLPYIVPAGRLTTSVARAIIINGFYNDFVIYWGLVGLAHGLQHYQQLQSEHLERAQLEAQLAVAHVKTLQMQLNPHFLFNTLNTISGLMFKDVNAAEQNLMRLAQMLRMTLTGMQEQQVPLRQELELIELYLQLQHARFGDRVTVKRDFDPAILDCMVPSLLLQPLVENAFVHAVSKSASANLIELSGRSQSGQLILAVKDNGPGARESVIEMGVGLRTTIARMDQMYGKAATVNFRSTSEGFTAEVKLPADTNALWPLTTTAGYQPRTAVVRTGTGKL